MDDPLIHRDHWRDSTTRALVAVENGRPVGVATMWVPAAHDTRYRFHVVVDPAHCRHGTATALFRALVPLRERPLPFQAGGTGNSGRLAFARSLGARTIPLVPPPAVALSARERLRPARATVAGDSIEPDVLLAANAATYRWTHAAWAPTADGFEDVLAEAVRTEVDLGATSVALDPQGRPLALTVVYVDCDPPVITAETVAADTPDGERLLEGCLRRSFDVLASRGLSSVELDGHVSDPHLLPVWVRLEPTGQWFHLVEIPVDEI